MDVLLPLRSPWLVACAGQAPSVKCAVYLKALGLNIRRVVSPSCLYCRLTQSIQALPYMLIVYTPGGKLRGIVQ